MARYLVVIDGAGEFDHDFNVMAVEADTPRVAVERVTHPDMGYGKKEDGVAFVVGLSFCSVFRVNDTTRKAITPASFDEVVGGTVKSLRQFLDPDGGHLLA